MIPLPVAANVESLPRKRNAAATRTAMLEAARSRFARDGYDGVSMREIAAEAGVDAALVCRYFGSKDELFDEVLACAPGPDGLFVGDPKEFGARIAHMIVFEPQDSHKLECLFITLRSASSPKAAEAIVKSGATRFFGPFAEWLGGENAMVRAQLAGALMKGAIVNRAVSQDYGLSPVERQVFCNRLAAMLQQIVDG